MPSIEDLIAAMVRNPKGVAYADLRKVCVHHFGEPRRGGGSHEVFATPWAGDPRINIQNDKGKAKAYQVRQVLKALDKLADAAQEGADDE